MKPTPVATFECPNCHSTVDLFSNLVTTCQALIDIDGEQIHCTLDQEHFFREPHRGILSGRDIRWGNWSHDGSPVRL